MADLAPDAEAVELAMLNSYDATPVAATLYSADNER
jgi:hypothetical protein